VLTTVVSLYLCPNWIEKGLSSRSFYPLDYFLICRFHKVPGAIPAMAECAPNELVIRVQPDERIYWKITSKVPGLDFNVETRRMDLLYAQQQQQSKCHYARLTRFVQGVK